MDAQRTSTSNRIGAAGEVKRDRLGAEEMERVLGVTGTMGIHQEAALNLLAPESLGHVRVPWGGIESVLPEEGFQECLRGMPEVIRRLDLEGVKRTDSHTSVTLRTTCAAIRDAPD